MSDAANASVHIMPDRRLRPRGHAHPPHEPGAVEALAAATAWHVACRCAGEEIDYAAVIDDLCQAGWRLTHSPPSP